MKNYLISSGMVLFAFFSSYMLSMNSRISMESYLLTYVLVTLWGEDIKRVKRTEVLDELEDEERQEPDTYKTL